MGLNGLHPWVKTLHALKIAAPSLNHNIKVGSEP